MKTFTLYRCLILFLAGACLLGSGSSAFAQEDHINNIVPIDGPPVELEPITVDYSMPGQPPTGIISFGNRGNRGSGGGGGGRDFEPNRGNRVEVLDAAEGDCDPCSPCSGSNTSSGGSNPKSGNPVVLSTGNKVETETDFAVAGGPMPLYLQRTYNHYWQYVGLFGKYWVSNFDYSLTWSTDDSEIFAQRPDGRRIRYLRQSPTSNRWNEDKAGPISFITKLTGLYTLYDGETENVETYDGGGRILKLKNNEGVSWTYAYTNDYLTSVTHTSGRSVTFTWTGSQLTKVTAPDASAFNYTYTANAYGSNINRLDTSATPNDTGNPTVTTTYHYEAAGFPGALTGKSIDNVRYSTFGYDGNGRANLSQHHSATTPSPVIVDKYTYVYNGTYTPPTGGIPNPGQPGSHCDVNTHFCPALPLIDGSDPARAASNEQISKAEDALIATNPTSTSTTAETNPHNLVTTYTFTNGQLTNVSGAATSNCAARAKARSYDVNGYDDLVSDFIGNQSNYDYAANGQLATLTEPVVDGVARVTTFTWDSVPHNRALTATTNGFRRVGYSYRSDNRLGLYAIRNLSTVGVNELHQWNYAYLVYASGITQQMTIDGPLAGTADTVTYNYSAKGDLTSYSDGLGHTTTYSNYNDLGQPGTVVGPNGDQTDYTYAKGGRLRTVRTFPNGTTPAYTSYSYVSGLLKAVSTPDLVTTTYLYDNARRLTDQYRSQIGGLAYRKYAYDTGSGMTSVKDYIGDPGVGGVLRASSSTAYDDVGRVMTRTGNHGQQTKYTYDGNDNVKTITTVTTPANLVTTQTYDALNRLASTKDPNNGITSFKYDVGGRVSSVTDPRNLVTTYATDGFGQQWTEVSPDRGTTASTFSPTGLLASMQRGNAVLTTYGYDAIGRMTSAVAGSLSQSYTYDTCTNGVGRLCRATANNAVINYAFEADGRLRTRVDTISQPTSTTYTTSYGYDSTGRPSTITYPNGEVATYAYAAGQPSSLSLKIGTVTSTVVDTAGYEPFGPVNGWRYGNALTTTFGYDSDRRLTSLETANGATARQDLAYGYNNRDLTTGITNFIDSSLNKVNDYDSLSRLNPSAGQVFTFDANGNRKTKSGGSGVINTYSTTSNQLSGTNEFAPSSVFTHDGAGNLKSYFLPGNGTVNYNYDSFNRMATMDVSGIVKGWYWYNAKGERVSKRGISSTGVEQKSRFVYDEGQRLISERDDTAANWSNYLWFAGRIVGLSRNGTLYYVHSDHVGRPELITTSTGAVIWKSSNDAFGNSATNGAITFKIGLPGQYLDEENGLYYNVNRYYNPNWGRYMQVDPKGLAAGINPYVYVSNNPVMNSDPLGLEGPGSWSFPDGPMRDQYYFDAAGPKGPDFVTLSGSLYVVSFSVTVSRSGHVFVAPALSRDYPHYGLKPGVSLDFGALFSACRGKERDDAADAFIAGLGYSASYHSGIGGGIDYSPGNGAALMMGIGLGAGAGVSGGVARPTNWSLPGW